MATLFHGFRNLLRFGGRDPRTPFWLHAMLVTALATIGAVATILPAIADSFARMQRFAAAHPEQAHVERTASSYSIRIDGYHPELMPDLRSTTIHLGLVVALLVVLMAAAVARRLHDSGRSGWWGTMPLPFLAFGVIAMGKIMAGIGAGSPDFGWFFLLFCNNLIYLATLVALVVLLAMPGTSGQNRFGESPVPR